MKLTLETIKELPIGSSDKRILIALLDDIDFINEKGGVKVFINWIEHHTEYSPEWTDPCPDFYGMYTILLEDDPRESIGVEMDLEQLDNSLCALVNYIEAFTNEEVEP